MLDYNIDPNQANMGGNLEARVKGEKIWPIYANLGHFREDVLREMLVTRVYTTKNAKKYL